MFQISDLSPLITNPMYKTINDIYLDYNLIESIDLLENSEYLNNFRLLSLIGNLISKVRKLSTLKRFSFIFFSFFYRFTSFRYTMHSQKILIFKVCFWVKIHGDATANSPPNSNFYLRNLNSYEMLVTSRVARNLTIHFQIFPCNRYRNMICVNQTQKKYLWLIS